MLKVLLIGCGNIAGGFDGNGDGVVRTHAGAYAAHGQFVIVACVEPDEQKRADFMARWGIKTGYTSMEQLSNAHSDASSSTQFDVISICSPTAYHYQHALIALRLAPRLIFCEKPVCGDLRQAQSLVQLCADQGVLLAVNHNRRWDPEVTLLRDQLLAGKWGAIRSVTGFYNKGVLNNGSHMVDLLHDLLGPLTLINTGAPCFDYSEIDPSVPATFLSAAGVPVNLSCGHAGDYSLFELHVVTQRGVIAMEDGGLRWRVRLSASSPQFQGYQTLADGQANSGQYLQTMTNAVANIYRAVTLAEPLASTGKSALAAQLVCQQMLDRSLEIDPTNDDA